jgi:hypothetical protein
MNISTLVTEFFDKNKVEELFKTKTQEEWVVMTSNYDVCLSPVLEERRYMSKSTLKIGFKEVKIDEQRIYLRQT